MKNDKIRSLLFKYGFTEISDLIRFFQFICLDYINEDDGRYIFARLKKCLANHDDGTEYFKEMHDLLAELDKEFG